jgi:predicted HAD superfamily phosphohydrolase YqeG
MRKIIEMTIVDETAIEHLKLDLPLELKGKKLAVFDLDETLVHCEIRQPKKGDVLIEVTLPTGEKAKVINNI